MYEWNERKQTIGSLYHYLPLQVDLDMLNVSLGTGTLEVHSALLNTDYLDAQLVSTTSPFLYHLLACLLLHSAAHGGA